MENQTKMSTPFTSKELVRILTVSTGALQRRKAKAEAEAKAKTQPKRVIYKYEMTREEYDAHIDKVHG